MYVATGYAPALIDRFMEGTDQGKIHLAHLLASVSSYLCSHYAFYCVYVELDNLTLRMYVKWHHSWGRRITPAHHSS